MFTGLIEEIGVVKEKRSTGKGFRFHFSADKILSELKTGDSINVNGVCQTVVEFNNSYFCVDTVEETVKKTNFGSLKIGDVVNLERAMSANGRFGGHFVLGHVDAIGKILSINKTSIGYELTVKFDSKYSNYLIPVGSVAVDGISLTLADVNHSDFKIAVIPHTWENTILKSKKNGDTVNLEFDIIGKYVLKSLGKNSGIISEDWLSKLGY